MEKSKERAKKLVLLFFRKEAYMLESKFKTKLIKELKAMFPGCVVTHVTDIQGFPDLLILYKNMWAALEGKQTSSSHKQPNQNYFVDILNTMSFSKFITPENKKEVLDELQRAFKL